MFSRMTALVRSFVQLTWQTALFSGGVSVSNENGVTGSSPFCTSSSEKSMEERKTRAGVPVLKRRSAMPSFFSAPASSVAGNMPSGPPA